MCLSLIAGTKQNIIIKETKLFQLPLRLNFDCLYQKALFDAFHYADELLQLISHTNISSD